MLYLTSLNDILLDSSIIGIQGLGNLAYSLRNSLHVKEDNGVVSGYGLLPLNINVELEASCAEREFMNLQEHPLQCGFSEVIANSFRALYSSNNQNRCLRIKARKMSNIHQVVFEDNGYGISREDMPYIASVGYTPVDNRGLALFMIRQMLQDYQGSLVIESNSLKNSEYEHLSYEEFERRLLFVGASIINGEQGHAILSEAVLEPSEVLEGTKITMTFQNLFEFV